MNMAQIKAREKANKERILRVCPDATERSGIYIFTRHDGDFRFAYIGQAKHLLTRLAQHLAGYQQHIDLSVKKHGFSYPDGPADGWVLTVVECSEAELDEQERYYIRLYANDGYQLLNKTDGGQGKGKTGIAPNKPSKGYYDGLDAGYLKARKYVANLFDKHLDYSQKSDKPNKNQEKAMEKFKEFLDWKGE